MSEEALPSLLARMQTTPLRGAEGKALLQRLLSNMADGSGDTHLLAARALFSTADAAPEPEKTYLFDQLYFCLSKALEDYAMLCLMTWDESRHPMDIYLNMDRPELRAFYSRCRKNLLTEDQLFRVAGVAEAEALKRQGSFKLGLEDAEAALEWAARHARERLSLFGRLYHSTLEDADPLLGPWQIAYAKAPIGLKLVLDRESGAAEMLMGAEESPDPAEPGKKIAGAFSVEVELSQDFGEKILHYLDEICLELRSRAAYKLAFLEGPSSLLELVRKNYLQHLQALGAAKRAAAGEAPHSPAAAPGEPQRLKIFHSHIKPFTPKAKADPGAAKPESPAAPAPGAEDESGTASHSPGEVRQVGGIKIIHSQGMK